jgi:ATP-dependent helicase/nuclease subunit A
MTKAVLKVPADNLARERALDPSRSILVQAPAGSGKTTLLTERFLTLLGTVDEPGQVVAITFTNAAAAEMRNRVLDSLRQAEDRGAAVQGPARQAMERGIARGWKLLDLPVHLRIGTIDSFCRELALQQPLLSGLGGGLTIAERPDELYRRAARYTLDEIGSPGHEAVSTAVEALLTWRDNNWQELEDLLVQMLADRARWMREFVLSRDVNWEDLRQQLERPFEHAVRQGLEAVSGLLKQVPGAGDEALALARFACSQDCGEQHRALAELVKFPAAPFMTLQELEAAHQALISLGNLVLSGGGTLRLTVNKRLGFPAHRKTEKNRLLKLIADLRALDGLEQVLCAVRALPPARYTADDWEIVKACFTLLRYAAGQLKVVFAEAAAVDFTEVAQMAEEVLKSEEGFPSDAAQTAAEGIRHLLVDEFQDTSRRQHQLLAGLIAAWPERIGRTIFAVGDPMQSIYFFREADSELFGRVKQLGLEIPNGEPLDLEYVQLSANFRTVPKLVNRLNQAFSLIFDQDDGSGVQFSPAEPALEARQRDFDSFVLHTMFTSQPTRSKGIEEGVELGPEETARRQLAEIIQLIQGHRREMREAKEESRKFRVAVLGRTRTSLAPIAEALRESGVPFRAIDLEKLGDRAEVLDALALARALLNAQDRVAWLGVLRAPWCGLGIVDLHAAVGGDDAVLLKEPVPELLHQRLGLLSSVGRVGVERILAAVSFANDSRASFETAALGTWLEQIWLRIGGADCYDIAARANLDLLWKCLDGLQGGAADVLGPALAKALEKLTALPDPTASSDVGVQLMTIHKSKGLEFEVVIVPDLQARTAPGGRKLLSWMERGVNSAEDGREADITEFLIAPLPSRGEDAGSSKRWVDRQYRRREEQETRRLLYVAATRAREELHLFARPTYKTDANGELKLAEPAVSLLRTAWPALSAEIEEKFEAFRLSRSQDAEVGAIAAVAEGNLLQMPATITAVNPARLRRLPEEYLAPSTAPESNGPASKAAGISGLDGAWSKQARPSGKELYVRHEGGLPSRALGTAVHTLLEEMATLRTAGDWDWVRTELAHSKARISAQVRGMGIYEPEAAKIASRALELAIAASWDALGAWILFPHAEAASEVSWTGVIENALSTVRIDRVFRAGLTPLAEGQDAWWILDYKTAAVKNVTEMRPLFAGQLEAYARVLRNLHGEGSVVRAGLYYPRAELLDWWEV